MKLPLLFVLILIHIKVSCQLIKDPATANLALGAYSKNCPDAFSFTANVASLINIKKLQVGIYCEKRFLLNVAGFYTIAVVVPGKHGNFGFQSSYFGFSKFNETEFGVAYAKTLGKIDLGIRFNYNNISIPGYGHNTAMNFEIGGLVALTKDIIAGIQVYNPLGGTFFKSPEKLPAIYKLGIGYEASAKFYIASEIIKEEHQPVNVLAGFQYYFEKQLFIRAGITTETVSPYLAAGISWKNIHLDITGSYHPQLGFTPGLLLLFDITKKEL